MSKIDRYIIIGFLALIGCAAFFSLNSNRIIKTTKNAENKSEMSSSEIQHQKRNLKLVVSYGFGGDEKTITENATSEIIKSTIESINWNEFHIVQLEDESDHTYKALHVGGSLIEDGLASGFVTNNDHILMVKPIGNIEEMTEILLAFLKGEDVWRDKYEYE